MLGSRKAATQTATDGTTGAVAGDFADLMRAIKNLVDPYRPELYYMRGPGPKWQAKHDPAHHADGRDAVPSLAPVKG